MHKLGEERVVDSLLSICLLSVCLSVDLPVRSCMVISSSRDMARRADAMYYVAHGKTRE